MILRRNGEGILPGYALVMSKPEQPDDHVAPVAGEVTALLGDSVTRGPATIPLALISVTT